MKAMWRHAREPDADSSAARAPRTRQQKLYLALFAALSATILLGLVWVLVTGLMARSQLQAAERDVPLLKQAISAGKLDNARTLATHIADDASSARSLTSGPAWWTVSNLPVLGAPLISRRCRESRNPRPNPTDLPCCRPHASGHAKVGHDEPAERS